ncbi:hypothetical protein PHYBOEH_007169 [Phytophthora boehmeriae]|uniref:Uncharacterized protein n=1 Tax=Phytophthora boehmeriae TaxID=109152 RepID=A0A8T1W9X1_9STRA|nr:hypothetical protein PHYBOEH_007169 [Phytophthora boehmeriae]
MEGDSIVLEEEIDPNYEPTEKEPLRSEAKDFGGSGIRHDAASDDFKREDMFKPLSKNPLKSVQGKKTLLSASPSMLSKDDTDQSPHVASANFDQQREKLDQEHADKLREIQNEHEIELEALRKKMKVQLDDLQDAEEMKLKQLRRELDKKKHDLENQFDLEENALQRSRKDQLRRIETENEQALDRKKQELDSDFRSETEKLRQMHEEKQRRLQEELDQEAKQISERLQASLGEKKDAADLALELNTEIERLRKEQTKHGEELGAIRSESTTLLHGKSAAEAERDKIQLEVDELRRQLSITRESDTVASAPLECTQCPLWEDRVSSVEVERDIAQEEREKLRNELIFLKRESEARADAAREKVDVMTKASSEKDCEIQALREQEAQLKREMTKLQQRLAALEVESNDLRVKCALLQEVQSSTDPSNQTVPASAIVSEEQLNALESQLAAAKAEVANTKDELSDLQDRYAVTTTTNAQIKEQLMKESNEKKALQERLDLRTEEASQKADVEANKHRQQLEHLQHQLETESQARKKQEDEVNYLRKELQDLKLAKREAEAGLGQLEGDTRQEELYAAEHSEMAKRILELESEVGRLQTKVDNLEKQLSTSRSEKEDLAKDKASVEVELGNVRHMMERLQRQLSVERVLDVSVEGHRKCMKCPALKDQISSLESECTGARSEMEKVRGNFTHLQQEFKDRMAAEREKADLEVVNLRREKESEAQVFAEQEVLLKREISTLRQRLTTIETESSELRAQCAFLQSAKEAATQNQAAASSSATVIQEQINVVERQLTTAKAEVISTKSELRTLQDQYAEISTANSLIKEQLVRESDEKNTLRKKLELKGEEIAHSLSVEVSKHRQRLEELQHQLERETQARRDREDACDVLRKELQTAEQGKRKAEAELGQLESDKRHLVSEKSMLKLRLDEMNMSRQREESSAVSAEEALASKKLEVERLRSNLRLAGEDKDHLEARIKVLNQEYEQLQSKAHRLEEEYENERLRCRTIEKDRDSASQRQQSLADDLENSQRKSSSLAAEVLELQGLLSKAKSNEQATTSKADQVTKKLHELEQRKEREDFSMKMKLQQVEVELQNIVHNKERAEMQLQSREKELKAAKDEIARMGSEIESLETRIKAILIDKEEAHAALLNASVATATTASPRHTSSKPLDPAVDVMLVKLQLANTNRNELEIHLADISAQLEDSTRRCASLEGRCRDQSLEIELLHVEVSSLRSASLKMHVSALDSLALVERLEYEHKKRALRSDFLIQLRDFKEREEEALVRHKARLRARYERHLDELVADLEKMRQERVEQEEAQTAQMLERIRQERDAKRNDAEQKVREELNLFEQELHERKAREIGIITKAIEKEEEELGARLRELHQACNACDRNAKNPMNVTTI